MSKRIADRLRVEEPVAPTASPKWDLAKVRASIAQAQLIDVDDVADMVFRGLKPGDAYELAEYPNVAPPFEVSWFEYRRPAHIAGMLDVVNKAQRDGRNMGDGTFGAVALPDRVGCLVSSERTDTGWFSYLGFFIADATHPKMLGPIMVAMEADTEGHVLQLSIATRPDASTGSWAALQATVMNLEMPILMATSLLHAKNVTLEREDPVPPQLAKAYAKRHGGVQRVRFHRLHIEPMRRIMRNPDGSEPSTIDETKKALHVVRGHFGDYREGRGLFGKLHGIYWWDAQARGSMDAGAIEKEYVVHKPKKVRA